MKLWGLIQRTLISGTLISGTLVSVPPLHAAEWIRVSSPNFEIYTTSPERRAQQILESFERAHDFFYREKPLAITSQLPVTLVAFASTKEYAPYSMNVIKPAYYITDDRSDYIVMSYLGDDGDWVAVHEYVHLLVRRSGLTIPLWLNEGMADVYSTLEERKGRMRVGTSPKGRVYSLTHEKWLRITDVVAMDTNSPAYGNLSGGSIFYAQSWLLAHMLMLSDAYAGRFPAFLAKVAESGSTQQAFSEVYGKSLAQVSTDMSAYFKQSSIGAVEFDATPRKADLTPARPATELEIGLPLAKLTGMLGRLDESAQRLEDLAAAHPGVAAIDEARAYLALRAKDARSAQRHFQLAIEHGASGWQTLWDYAVVLESVRGDRQARLDALRGAIKGNPGLSEARLMLGRDLYDNGDYAEALAELRRIDRVEPARALVMYLIMANAAVALQHTDEARTYADEAAKIAQRPEDQMAVEAVRARLEAGVGGNNPAARAEDDEVPERPVLRRGKQR